MTIQIEQHGERFFAIVKRDCGHVFESDVAWNDSESAERYGATLGNYCGCSICRDHRSER